MSDSDQVYLDRIASRLSASSQDDAISDAPEFMLAIQTSDGCLFLAPYQALERAALRPEDRLAENIQTAEVTLEFGNAVVKFEGDNLEAVLRLVQKHQLRRLCEAKGSTASSGFAVRNVRLGPRRTP